MVIIVAWQPCPSFIRTVSPSSAIVQGKKRSLQKTECPHKHNGYLSVESELALCICHVRGSSSATLLSPFTVHRITTSPSTLLSPYDIVPRPTAMTGHERLRRHKVLENKVEELHLENRDTPSRLGKEIKGEATNSNWSSPRDTSMKSSSQSPIKTEIPKQSPSSGSEKLEEVVGGEVTVKLEPGHPPKLARSSSHKIISKPAPLFHNHASKTEESKHTFQVLEQCSYTSKYIGSTEHGSMDCDCTEEWGKSTLHALKTMHAGILNVQYRQLYQDQLSMWARLRLHQSCNKDGMCW